MKTYILIRFDNQPRQEVSEKLAEIIDISEGKAEFISTPTVQITFFKSKLEHKQCYLPFAKITPPTAFFLIEVTDANVAINMPTAITKLLMKFLGKEIIELDSSNSNLDYSTMSLEQLNKLLNEAVENEEYEKCAIIRDAINYKKQ